TAAGSRLVRELTPAPDLDGWAITELLLKDLAPLRDWTWLVIDDVHELGPEEVLRQLELLVMRAPRELRLVLATRRPVRLGLHRLRLEGELAEIRPQDLRFSPAEARDMLQAAGVRLPDSGFALLYERTEGWAAGLRLAALSLAGHDGPARFAAEFSGTERTVAEYLLAEVLDRQPAGVRRLLLRTSVLERVSGPLADALTGSLGGERILQQLEQGVALARQTGRPYLEFTGRAYQGPAALDQSFARSAEYSRQAIELARRHGWCEEPATGVACMTLAYVLAWQGRIEEALPWIDRAGGTVRADAEPTTAVLAYYVRGLTELARGRDAAALAALQAAERLAGVLGDTQLVIPRTRAKRLLALVRMGETEAAGRVLGCLSDQDRDRGETRIALAVLRLAQGDPRAAAAA